MASFINYLGYKASEATSRVGRDEKRAPLKIVHQLRAENLGLWLTRGEQPKHVTY